MDKRKLQKITRDYLETIANASDFNFVDEDRTIPLTQVYVMLEAIKTEPPRAREQRDELAPVEERRQSAGLERPKEFVQPPVGLSQVLNENNHLVLLGEPGAGKTTTLNFIALCFAKQNQGWAKENLQLHEPRIPIKLPLHVYRRHFIGHGAQIILALALEVCSRLQTVPQEDAEEAVKRWLETGDLLILLDGLDEVQDNRAEVIRSIRQFTESPAGKSARIIVSSRLAGYVTQGGTFKEYILKPLQTELETTRFLEGWLSSLKPEWHDQIEHKSKELLKLLQGRTALRRLLDNPLILRMAAQQYAKDGKLERNRAQLYKDYVEKEAWQRACRRGAQESGQKEALMALEALAWQSQMGEGLTEEKALFILQGKQNPLATKEAKANELLDLVHLKMGILVLVDQKFVFSHTTFREYFVARRLHRAWKNRKNGRRLTWKFLHPRLHLSAWRESLLLFSGLLDTEKETVDFINRVYSAKSQYERKLKRDFKLAASMIGENDAVVPGLIKRYTNAVMFFGYWTLSGESLEALLNIGSQAIPILLKALQDKKESIREIAANALGNIGDPQAIPDLIQALKDEYDNYFNEYPVRSAAAHALGNIGSQAIPALIQALKDEDHSVRKFATLSLGYIGDSLALPALITALKDENRRVRSDAATALGEIGDPKAIPVLIQALEDEDTIVRWSAASALGSLGDSQAIPYLVRALKDENEYVRQLTATALGKIGDPQAIPALMEALKDEDSSVCSNAATALSEINDKKIIPSMIQALNDENKHIRKAAARVLGKLGDSNVLPELIQVVKDDDGSVRQAAVSALGDIGDPQAIPVLLQALKDKEEDIRIFSCFALSDIGGSQAIAALIQGLKDESKSVRVCAIEALDEIGDLQSMPALIESLQDQDNGVRFSAVGALGNIGSPYAIPAITQALKEDDKSVRRSAAGALGAIGDGQTIPALIKAMKDKDEYVRISATNAIAQIVQMTQFDIDLNKHGITIKTLNKVVKAMSRVHDNTPLTSVLDILGDLTAPRFDPLNPSQAKWVEVLMNVGKYLIMAILITLVGLAAFAFTAAEGTLKTTLEKWFQTQPITVVLVLLVCLTLLTLVGKQIIDQYFSKQK